MEVSLHFEIAERALEGAYILRHFMLLPTTDAFLRGGLPPADGKHVVLRLQPCLHPAEAAVLHGLSMSGLLPSREVLVLDVDQPKPGIEIGDDLVRHVVLSVNQPLMLFSYPVDCSFPITGAFLLPMLLPLQPLQVLRFFNLDVYLLSR